MPNILCNIVFFHFCANTYILAPFDEFGNLRSMNSSSAIQYLKKFSTKKRIRSVPVETCKRRNKNSKIQGVSSSSQKMRLKENSLVINQQQTGNGYITSKLLSASPNSKLFSVNQNLFNTNDANLLSLTNCKISSPLKSNNLYDVCNTASEPNEIALNDSDNECCFEDEQMGGVSIALSHGSILFECARHEVHATSGLKYPDRKSPARVSLVFYQHRSMNYAYHGKYQSKAKLKTSKQCANDMNYFDDFEL